MTNKQELREELSNPAIGNKDHLRKIALALLDELEAAEKRVAELEAREVTLPQVLDVHPLGPQSAKMFWAFKRDVVNECADRIRAAGIRINGEG